MHLDPMEVLVPINLSTYLLNQRHPKCIITQIKKPGLSKEFRFCSVGLKNISVNNTITILNPTRLPESDITKYIENCSVCFFDLEATGLSDDFEIAQVSAVDFDGLGLFDQYLYPNGSIRFGSSKVTGITKSSGKLF